ncbi:hypothetical protein SLEP1_g6827 [Rubroshorea leprosula]|uniref:Uncharacterized protein n=1 Tax=Rubroshorea leprosula TaxID=152421 RepID=A0AAV5I7A5_9ROSI|nr:hypothetical protein SLEP1_g6827 [Rubroshorea leprosula]
MMARACKGMIVGSRGAEEGRGVGQQRGGDLGTEARGSGVEEGSGAEQGYRGAEGRGSWRLMQRGGGWRLVRAEGGWRLKVDEEEEVLLLE